MRIAEQIDSYGIIVSLLVFLSLVGHMVLHSFSTGESLITVLGFQEFINHFSTAIALIVVGVPEGLPMAISLGLAF